MKMLPLLQAILAILAILTVQLLAGLPAAQALPCTDPTIPASNPDSSYSLHADGTATDTRTGLIWKRCAEGQIWNGSTCTGSASLYSWPSARTQAATSRFAGENDWRLPNRKELFSLVEKCRISPAINGTVFPATPSSFFWSASPGADGSASAWGVYFDNGYVINDFQRYDYQVRLVRGSQLPGLNAHFYTLAPGEYAHRIQITATTPATQPCGNEQGRALLGDPKTFFSCGQIVAQAVPATNLNGKL